MPAISIPTPFNIDLEFNIASVGKRLLGFLLDCLVLWLYSYLITNIVLNVLGADLDGYTRRVLIWIILWFPVLFYGFFMEWLANGQTLGKMALGMRVVNMTGHRASVSQYLIRAVFGPFMLVIPIFLFARDVVDNPAVLLLTLALIVIGIFLLFITSNKVQRLGDRIADTLVISTRSRANIHSTIFRDIADDADYTVLFPQVMKLTDRDINGIRNLLNMKAGNRDTENYISRIAERVVQILKLETSLEPRAFLEQLLWDYNYLSKKR